MIELWQKFHLESSGYFTEGRTQGSDSDGTSESDLIIYLSFFEFMAKELLSIYLIINPSF